MVVEPGRSEPNWQAELQRLVVLKKLLQCSDINVKVRISPLGRWNEEEY